MGKLKLLFQLDLRSLSAFRIALGCCLCFDLFQKLIYSRALYSDWGVMPRSYWISEYLSDWKISLMLANGEAWFQAAFIGCALLLAIFFTLGIRTKLSQILLLIFIGSIHSRNHLILSCGDDLMTLGLFWSVLLPLDHYYSLTKRTFESLKNTTVNSPATVLLILQLVIMYWVTALYKIHPVWTEEHSAIYYALNVEHFTTEFGRWLKDFTELGKLLTEATLSWEILGPLLLFIPFANKKLRTVSSLGFIGFHLGLALCLKLGTFPWVAMSYWLIFLPGEFWQRPADFLSKTKLFLWLSKCSVNADEKKKYPRWQKPTVTAAFSLLMVFVVIQNIADYKKFQTPEVMRHVLWTLNLNQVWDMFAPIPVRNDGWFVIEGHFQDGEVRDLLTDKPLSFQRPELISDLYSTSEWRKFYLNLWDQGNQRILLPFARFLCRSKLSTADNSSLQSLKIYFMKKTTPPPGQEFPPIEKVELWSHGCFL